MEDAEIDLRRLFGLVRRRIFAISAATFVSAGLALAASLVVVPIYSATSLVAFDPQHKDLLDPTTSSHAAIADNARIESEVELLRSDTVLLKVIADRHLADDVVASPGLRTHALAALGLKSPPQITDEHRQVQALARLRGALSVERRGPTYLIAVNVKSADPTQAADLANAIAQTYIDTQIASKVESMLSSRDVLQTRLLAARSEIISSEAAFQRFLEQSIVQLAASADGGGVERLNRQLQALAEVRAEADERADLLEANLSSKNWEGLQAAFASELSPMLAQQRQALATQISNINAVSPSTQQMAAGLTGTEQELVQFADAELVNLRTILAGLDAQQNALREQLHDEVLGSDLPADILTGLFDLQSKAVFAQEQYKLLLNRLLELQNQADLQIADSRIASPALPPSSAVFPNTGIFLALGMTMGMVMGLAGSLVYESLVGGFISREQLEASLRTRVASTIPRIKLQTGNDLLADLVITAPLSEFSESMRRTRIALDATNNSALRPGGQVVMVTSAVLGEGKTTTALALARSYALSGRRTLLIECDLRKPVLAAELGINPSIGLLNILAGHATKINLRSAIAQETDTGLSLLLGTQGSDRPTDTMLASAQFERVLAEAASLFDLIVLDTPPVEPVVDALYLAPRADTIILVSRWASTSQREIKQTLASLNRARRPETQILSVLNATDQAKPGRRQVQDRFYNADQAWQFVRPSAEWGNVAPYRAPSFSSVPVPTARLPQQANIIGLRHRTGEAGK